jgi:hypothetical protein
MNAQSSRSDAVQVRTADVWMAWRLVDHLAHSPGGKENLMLLRFPLYWNPTAYPGLAVRDARPYRAPYHEGECQRAANARLMIGYANPFQPGTKESIPLSLLSSQ